MRTWIASRPGWKTAAILVRLGLMLGALAEAQAQPTLVQTAGPGGGEAGSLACAPDGDLFVIANGIYRSADGGASWVKLTHAPAGSSGVVVDPSGALYAFRYGAIHRSVDDGQTWQHLASAPSQMVMLYFDTDGHAYAGTYVGLYRSADAGATWALVGMSGLRVGAIAQTADGTLYAGAGAGLYRSLDAGVTWQLFSSLPDHITAIAEHPQGGLYLGLGNDYNGGPSGGVYHVDAVGMAVNVGLPHQWIESIVVQDDGDVFVAGSGTCGDFVCYGPGLFRSLDDGVTWTFVTSGVSPVQSLVQTPSGTLFASTGHLFTDIGMYPASGVLRSDQGSDWKPASNGLVHAATYDMAAGADGTVWAAADVTVFYTQDAGAAWFPVVTPPPAEWGESNISYRLAVHPSGDVLALSSPFLSRTRDRGTTWTALDPGASNQVVDVAVSAAGTLIGLAWGGAVRSVDRGDSWTFIDTGWSFPGLLYQYPEIAVGSLGSIAVASQTHTHLSEDDGLTWTAITPLRGPLAFAPDESALYVADRSSGVQQLVRHGNQWIATPLPGSPSQIGELAVDAVGWVYAHGSSGVARSRVGETSWTTVGGLVPEYSFLLQWRSPLLIAPDNHLYAGTANAGIFRSSTPLGTPSNADLALGAGAWRVFPNPFRGRTTFAFALPAAERVTLELYDVRGRLVATLADGRRLPAGPHGLTWSTPPGTPSGAYFYRLDMGSSIRSGRLLLLD